MDLTTNSYGQVVSGRYTLGGRVDGGDVLSATAHRAFDFDANHNSISDDDLDEAIGRALADSSVVKRDAAIAVINTKRVCLDADQRVDGLVAQREKQIDSYATPRAVGVTVGAGAATVAAVVVAHALHAFATVGAAFSCGALLLLLVGFLAAMLAMHLFRANAPRDAGLEQQITDAATKAEQARATHRQAWERLAICFTAPLPAVGVADSFEKT